MMKAIASSPFQPKAIGKANADAHTCSPRSAFKVRNG
jgi:hypothetical protein